MASAELDDIKLLLRGIDYGEMSLADRRALRESMATDLVVGASVEPVEAGGVPAEWIVAPGPEDRTILYLHGGAYHMGSLASTRRIPSLLAAAAQAKVLNIGYRLAPEHPFPAALHDAVAAYRWLLDQGASPSRIAVAGDSSGGGLALGTLLALRDAGDALPAACVAISPVTDLAATGKSMQTRADVELMLRPDGMKETADWYLAGQDVRHPYASPLYGDPAGLPALLLHVGDAEILLDDSTRFAAKADAAGVDVTLEVWPEMPHVWHAFAGMLPEADAAIAGIADWLGRQID